MLEQSESIIGVCRTYLSAMEDVRFSRFYDALQCLEEAQIKITQLSTQLNSAHKPDIAGLLHKLAVSIEGRADSCSFFDAVYQTGYQHACRKVAEDLRRIAADPDLFPEQKRSVTAED